MSNIELFCGDCLEKMKNIPDNSIDLVLTDPPYGTTACKWDSIISFELMWKELKRITKKNSPVLLFGQEPFSSYLRISNIEMFKYDWIWIKERPTNVLQIKKRPGKNIESISVFYNGQCLYYPQKFIHEGPLRTNKVKNGSLGILIDSKSKSVNEYRDDGTRYPLQTLNFKRDVLKSNLHPTQKPVELLEYLIKTYTNENETVLDFTMGSGSTGVAAKNLNRNFIGIELDKKYFEIDKKRIDESSNIVKNQ